MDWLMQNPIADMYGPHFFFFYAIVIVFTLAACWWRLRQSDPTASLPPLKVPTRTPNPYETAYLRGEESEVARVAIFNLLQRGYLRVTEESNERIEQVPDHPHTRHLSQMEREVFDWFHNRLASEEIFQSELPSEIKYHYASFDQRLEEEQLLMPAEVQEAAQQIRLKGAIVIVGLGGYKLLFALMKGQSKLGLVLLGLFSLGILFSICETPRLSSRGRAYLQKLQLAFEGLKERALAATKTAAGPTLLLTLGLFGVGVLAGTPYEYYQRMFHKSTGSEGSCGGGCGGCGGG